MKKTETKHPDYYHTINHSFKPVILVPYGAISHNIDYMLTNRKSGLKVRLPKGVKAEVLSSEEVCLCEPTMERLVQQLYGMHVWDFIKRWHSQYPAFEGVRFVKFDLKMIEE